MDLVIFIVMLAVLVLIHEAGHYVAAKLGGIRVDEFGLGFPPRAWGKKIGETIYSVNWLPFGGFVRIFGEDGVEGADQERSFVNANRLLQAAILVAGVAMNALLAWLLISVGFALGLPTSLTDAQAAASPAAQLLIVATSPNSPAAAAGIEAGDQIIALESGNDTLQTISVTSVQDFINGHGTNPILLTYKRGGKDLIAMMTPSDAIVNGHAAIGVSLDEVGPVTGPWYSIAWQGLEWTWDEIAGTAETVWGIVADAFHGHSDLGELTGPVGMVSLVGQAQGLGWQYLISLMAFISANLAVVNLLPLPALDGGRLVIVGIEAIKRRPVSRTIVGYINTIGFAALILLMLVITFHDVVRLIG